MQRQFQMRDISSDALVGVLILYLRLLFYNIDTYIRNSELGTIGGQIGANLRLKYIDTYIRNSELVTIGGQIGANLRLNSTSLVLFVSMYRC